MENGTSRDGDGARPFDPASDSRIRATWEAGYRAALADEHGLSEVDAQGAADAFEAHVAAGTLWQ